MKKILAIIAMTILITTFSFTTGVKADDRTQAETNRITSSNFINYLIEIKNKKEETERINKENKRIAKRAFLINQRIESLQETVGKTWYVFSGSTPRGWDCSGLVLWFYSELGSNLTHSVTAQMNSGEIVQEPMIGDIVTFKYRGSSRGYHNGVYVGNDLYIHSPRPGKLTSLASISGSAGSYSEVVYTRINIDVLE
jgi:cell wall-associated NlpC family hydrolase